MFFSTSAESIFCPTASASAISKFSLEGDNDLIKCSIPMSVSSSYEVSSAGLSIRLDMSGESSCLVLPASSNFLGTSTSKSSDILPSRELDFRTLLVFLLLFLVDERLDCFKSWRDTWQCFFIKLKTSSL